MSLDIPTTPDLDALAKLREAFPPEQIGKLPKGGVLLDFLGHGYLTARFLDVDPLWDWQPFATDSNGLPLLDEQGGLWIRLTIAGMTRIGYGDANGKTGPNAVKEAIGDALRNAGMRFGAALDLWCKGDPDAAPTQPPTPMEEALADLDRCVAELGLDRTAVATNFYAIHKMPPRSAPVETVREFTRDLYAEDHP